MINLLATNDFLGYTSGKIVCNDSNSRYTMDQNDTYKILWVQKGSVKITFNRTNVVLKKNHCLFIDKNASLIINTLDNFQLSYIQFTEPNLVVNHELSLIISNSGLFDSDKVYNRILLKDNYLKIVQHYTDLLLSLQLKKRNLLNKCLGLNTLQQILLLAISSFDAKNDKIDILNEKVPNKKLIDSFNMSIKKNIRNERNVKFYCEELGVDYNVLNKICLKTYGVNVKSYLDLKMLSGIKSVLEDTTLAIKEISDYFNFSDTSNFLRFFKRVSNMTVSEYRNSFKQKTYGFPVNNQVNYIDVSVN